MRAIGSNAMAENFSDVSTKVDSVLLRRKARIDIRKLPSKTPEYINHVKNVTKGISIRTFNFLI